MERRIRVFLVRRSTVGPLSLSIDRMETLSRYKFFFVPGLGDLV